MTLKDKKILLGITGGIAAYKSAFLLRLLKKEGAEVQVLATESSKAFIGPVTLSTLSKNPVYYEHFNPDTGQWVDHVQLGLWADLMIVAPCTSNTLAKMANGISDNLLMTTYLSAKCPVLLAPAMDLDMAFHPSLERNIQLLLEDGVHVLPFDEGELASGLSGKGRMKEPEDILHQAKKVLDVPQDFKGTSCLITAGPTHEPLDPVRFIGNNSTGKMGTAIANELSKRGASVHLILGPTQTPLDFHHRINVLRVQTAEEMSQAANTLFPSCDVAVCTAAVADYRPEMKSDEKIKKSSNNLTLDLVKNPDILKSLGHQKTNSQVVVGFALETQNEVQHAQGKLERKKADLIVLNSLKDSGAGFGHDTNKVTLLFPDKPEVDLPLKSKSALAQDICNEIKILIKA
jgi:phosphopantothenoylcysteine decarboxylase/phosphopantothenate--cysteine ligase